MTARTQMGCERCGGTMIVQYDEATCLACGYTPPNADDLRLAAEAEQEFTRRRGPRIGGLKLN